MHFPSVPALVETDRQLLANGITTAYHGLTLSWEPGLRGTEGAREFLAALAAARPHLGCDTRLHLRFETYNLDMVAKVEAWLAEGRIDLLAFNDHTEDIIREMDTSRIGVYLGRTRLDEPAFRALVARVCARGAEVPAAVERFATAAVRAWHPDCFARRQLARGARPLPRPGVPHLGIPHRPRHSGRGDRGGRCNGARRPQRS